MQSVNGLAKRQGFVVSRSQGLNLGLSPKQVFHLVSSGRWQRIHRGVYLTHSGDLTWLGRAWAAVLCSGAGAALSHAAAGHIWGLMDRPPSVLWVAIPERRTIVRPAGTRVIRRRCVEVVQRSGLPLTSVRQTVLDLTAMPGFTLDETAALLGRAAQRGLLVPQALLEALDTYRRHPLDAPLRRACADAADGVESALESRILRNVIRAHGLSGFALQVPVAVGATAAPSTGLGASGGTGTPARPHSGAPGLFLPRNDLRNLDLGIRIEADGVAWHADRFHEDRRRDRKAAATGDLTIRVTWDAAERPCEVALDIACAMTHRGWQGTPTPCGPACDVPRRWASSTGRAAS